MSLFDSKPVTVGASPTEIYTLTTDVMALSLLLTNGHFGSLPVSAWIDRAGVVINLAVRRRVPAGQAFDALGGSKVALKSGDKVFASCPIPSKFTGMLSAYRDE